MNALSSFLRSLKGKKILIATHSGADIDAIGASGALFLALNKKFEPAIVVPEHISLSAKALAENLQIPYKIDSIEIESFDGIIIVDLNSPEMLGSLKEKILSFKKPLLLIDHHIKVKRIVPSGFSLIDEKKVSSTEIVFGLLKDFSITPKIASLLAAGIIADSAHFQVSDNKTFYLMSVLLKKSNKSFSQLNELFSVKMDESEKIAKLKAAKRSKIIKIGNYILATTNVGAFEADAASALVKLGADAVFAGNCEKGKIKISARAKNSFIEETKIDLVNDVFSRMDEEFKGNSGGHKAAAAFNGKGENIEQALDRCTGLIEGYFKSKKLPSSKKYYES